MDFGGNSDENMDINPEELEQTGINSRKKYLNYGRVQKANTLFVSNLADFMNTEDNLQSFEQMNNQRDTILKEIKKKPLKPIKEDLVEESEHLLSEKIEAKPLPKDYLFDRSTNNEQDFIANINTKPKNLEGYLYKRSGNFLVGWQKRWVVLHERVLWYFEKKGIVKPNGVLNFDQLSIKIKISKSKPQFSLFVIGSNKIFEFRCSSLNARDKWIKYIKAHYQKALGSKLNLRDAVRLKDFWRTPQVGKHEFLTRVNNGDLLLFKSNNIGATMQRVVSNSEYDHVAMLLRYDNDDVFLFESTGFKGVSLCNWKYFIKKDWHLLYPKLVWRELRCVRDESFIHRLQDFLAKTVGKKYDLNPKKLLKQESLLNSNLDLQEKEGYFCSELAAAAYKHLGFLPKEKSSSQYWPVSFSLKENLQLINGASLGVEMLINFDI